MLLRNNRFLIIQSYGRAVAFSILGMNYLVDSKNMQISTPVVLVVQARLEPTVKFGPKQHLFGT